MKIEKLDGVFVETFTTTCASPLAYLEWEVKQAQVDAIIYG
jgi:hypothetical protein